ncbi:hypothetical protein [Plantibacter sp. CFBP 8775]|uniref:hypothetical protein n=1 Tax=Plantibacter sp. CFBP 8775 TaxID=2774038 RepID=UPI00177E180F|nr:hypothetical protein [Plantibacter sp. CFBP 8775]MBD8104757.1 hypothetical protein [Plantibacter sp. CFBP 8775]
MSDDVEDPWGTDGADAGAAEGDPTSELLLHVVEGLEGLGSRVEAVEKLLLAQPDGPWTWASLNGEQQQKLFTELYEWVTWLEDRYLRYLGNQKAVLIADWYRHPIAVELLTALMVAHHSVYRVKASAASFGLVEWHERCLFPTLERLIQLNLFPQDVQQLPRWDGPELRPTKRDQERFTAFVDEIPTETDDE